MTTPDGFLQASFPDTRLEAFLQAVNGREKYLILLG
jgi:hypothetical protein